MRVGVLYYELFIVYSIEHLQNFQKKYCQLMISAIKVSSVSSHQEKKLKFIIFRILYCLLKISDHLNIKLENYIEKFDGKIKLLRNKEREGLIRTRSRGALAATGEVILFLDAHCEVGYNWLPPLLAPIYRDRYVVILKFKIFHC